MKRHISRLPTTDDRRRTTDEQTRYRPSIRRLSSIVYRLLLLICLLLPGGVAAQARESALVIPAGETYVGNLATFTRDIRVEGVVTGDVTSWSGAIEIAGQVGGDDGREPVVALAAVHGIDTQPDAAGQPEGQHGRAPKAVTSWATAAGSAPAGTRTTTPVGSTTSTTAGGVTRTGTKVGTGGVGGPDSWSRAASSRRQA